MYGINKGFAAIILALLLLSAGFGLFMSCSKEPEQVLSDVEYYTCAMHPSVHEKKPGSCPICGMDLIPVLKKTTADSQNVSMTFPLDQEKLQLIGVKSVPVQTIPLHKIIRTVGRVDYNEKRLAVVNLKFRGWIEHLYADYTGQTVKRGEALFDIYSPDLLATQQELLNAMKFTTPEYATVDQAGDSIRVLPNGSSGGQELINNIRQRLLLSGMSAEQIKEVEKSKQPAANITIPAPIDGVIINKAALAGMYVEPGMELYKIADLSTVWIYADIYENELSFITLNQTAGVTLTSRPGEVYTSKIIFIFPYLNAATRTGQVRLEQPNNKGLFRPEMYANVTIEANLGERLAVPTDAVINTGERQIVFVEKSAGLMEARLVQIGVNAGEFTEIISGVSEGENVVAKANFLIDSESKIQGIMQSGQSDMPESLPGMEPEHDH